MPKSAKTITINNNAYKYMLKAEKHGMKGWTGKRMELVVEYRTKTFKNIQFESKLWTENHENNASTTTPHKAGFLPSDVRNTINALELGRGELPERFETGNWKWVKLEKVNRRAG